MNLRILFLPAQILAVETTLKMFIVHVAFGVSLNGTKIGRLFITSKIFHYRNLRGRIVL